MRKLLSLVISSLLATTTLVAITSPQASAAPTLTTCTNLETGKTLVLRSADAQCRSHLGSALWVQEQSDNPSHTGDGYATITVCSSKNPISTYRFIKDSCPKFQVTTKYWRSVAAPATPIIEAVSARGHDSAALFIKPISSAPSAPVLYYLVTETKSGLTRKVFPGNLGHINISGLSAESTYTFTIAAVNVDGTSATSLATPTIRTTAAPVVTAAAPIALTCATGGTCAVGDTGPGGGRVFYVATTPFACGPTRSATCKYLEAAPNGWNTGGDPIRTWATNVNSNRSTSVPAPGALQTAIGTGFQNSVAIVAQTGNVAATSAAVEARAYSGNGLTDWYLPSTDELNQMCKWVRGQAWTSDATACNSTGALNTGLGAAGFVNGDYWSSSESFSILARYQGFDSGSRSNRDKGSGSATYLRPVRAF
jgi:hypothetical protein